MASLHPDMHTETSVYITINVTIGIIHTVVHYMYKLEWEPVVMYGMVCLCEGGKQHCSWVFRRLLCLVRNLSCGLLVGQLGL